MSKELHPLDYVSHAIKNVRVIWLGRKAKVTGMNDQEIGSVSIVPENDLVRIFDVLEIKTRCILLETLAQWNAFADTAYSLHVTHGNAWWDKEAKKELLFRYAKDHDYLPRRSNRFEDNVITTVFDELSQKRLIVDGTNRACLLEREIVHDGDANYFQPMQVWEAYGKNVNALFPCDIHQLRDIV